MKVKTGLNLIAILASLAFGPKENRDLLFRTPPDRLYGETEVFRGSVQSWSVVRNASAESVELLDAMPVRIWSMDPRDGSFYESKTDKRIYAGSVAVVERESGGAPTVRSIRIGNAHPRAPRALHISTEAEAFYQFLWPGMVVFLAVILTYMINDFSWECGSPIRDILGSEE